MNELNLTAGECEELIRASVDALKSSWDVLGQALIYAYESEFWKDDGGWGAYCARVMGMDRDFPKVIRDLLIVAMTEAGISSRPVAEAMGVDRKTVNRVAQSAAQFAPVTKGTDGKYYSRPAVIAPQPIDPVKEDWVRMMELIKEMNRTSDKLSSFRPNTRATATTLQTDIERMIKQLQRKLADLQRLSVELPETGDDD